MDGIVSPRLTFTLALLCLLGQHSVHCNEAFEPFFSIDEPRTIVYTAKPEKTTVVTSETTSAPAIESDEGSGEADLTVCTPTKVICQKVLEMLELIAREISIFQQQAQQQIAASQRQESTKGCGLIQLTQLLEQLQRQNANNRTVGAS